MFWLKHLQTKGEKKENITDKGNSICFKPNIT